MRLFISVDMEGISGIEKVGRVFPAGCPDTNPGAGSWPAM